jgi:DNA-binding MarR family transcriptional regulator
MPDDIPARLAFATGRLNRRLRAVGVLSHGPLSVLATVSKYGPMRPAEIAQLESVSAPSTTRLITELEATGMISRAADPDDGRAVLITVTDLGTETIAAARAARAAMVAELFEGLTDEEVQSIAAALPALEKMVDRPGL